MQQTDTDLSQKLASVIPGALATRQTLPQVPELSLWLMDEAYPQFELGSDDIARIMQYPAYWAFCWASGQVMARWILDNPGWVRGLTVLDFGCGSGVVAIAAAKAGAARVIACDNDPDALLATRKNAAIAGVTLDYLDDFDCRPAVIDRLLVADVLYDRANLPLLKLFLRSAEQVLVADSRIRNFSEPGYERVLKAQSCTVPDLSESEEFNSVSLYLGSALQATEQGDGGDHDGHAQQMTPA